MCIISRVFVSRQCVNFWVIIFRAIICHRFGSSVVRGIKHNDNRLIILELIERRQRIASTQALLSFRTVFALADAAQKEGRELDERRLAQSAAATQERQCVVLVQRAAGNF